MALSKVDWRIDVRTAVFRCRVSISGVEKTFFSGAHKIFFEVE
jgi:hypothetical protein